MKMKTINNSSIRVFLCHASNDKFFVRELYKKLIKNKFDVWFDEEQLLPGQNWDKEIQNAVRLADVAIICLSSQSVTKEGYIQKEIKVALDIADEKPEGAIFIIPIRIEDCAVPERIKHWQWIDLFSLESEIDNNNYEKLVKSLELRAKQKETSFSSLDYKGKCFTPYPFFFMPSRAWIFPNYRNILNKIDLLVFDENEIEKLKNKLEATLSSLNTPATVVKIRTGPRIIRFEVEPLFKIENVKVNVSDISAVINDIAMSLSVKDVQVNSISDRSYISIDIFHKEKIDVNLLEILVSSDYLKKQKPLTVILGREIDGRPLFINLSTFPNILIGGATHSGKSTCLMGCIYSLLVNNSPNEVKILFVDIRGVEFSIFFDIPHLLSSIINDKDTVISAFDWLLSEANERKRLFSKLGAQNIEEYNSQAQFEEKLSFIVVFISELSDLIIPSSDKLQGLISKISGSAKITGIHLIATTQQLASEAIIDLKPNFQNRIALKTASASDSVSIINRPGAEKLFGYGDMLFQSANNSEPVRLQGVLISEDETTRLVDFWKSQSA